jgi:8-oxo-dGTP pyrophosphatase MutT (NUDIX family)
LIEQAKKKEVVVVLPYSGNKVLMQLRDFKENIAFPGHWGFFGGAIEAGETPMEAAHRELMEEICYSPDTMSWLNTREYLTEDDQRVLSHSFYFECTRPLDGLILKEGQDFGMIPFEEILSGAFYSKRLGGEYPVISHEYLKNTLIELFKRIAENRSMKIDKLPVTR